MNHQYELTNNILKEKTTPFDFANPQMDPLELYYGLRNTMIAKGGLGLAANQVGLPYSVFVVGDPRGNPENIVGFFNPKIVYFSEKKSIMDEGCLSYPGLVVNKRRSDEIRVRFYTHDGDFGTKVFTGMTSKIIQHECEHLEGLTFTNGLGRYSIEKALKKAKRNGFNYTMKEIFGNVGN